ncbi:hypothetical protein, partial [Mycolicibacterium moriokaense]|uniref:hypothetical protein n=1 Tax=Mycolicibacterium moriokaense TaxID=39691 RepID=UPI001C64E9F0
ANRLVQEVAFRVMGRRCSRRLSTRCRAGTPPVGLPDTRGGAPEISAARGTGQISAAQFHPQTREDFLWSY